MFQTLEHGGTSGTKSAARQSVDAYYLVQRCLDVDAYYLVQRCLDVDAYYLIQRCFENVLTLSENGGAAAATHCGNDHGRCRYRIHANPAAPAATSGTITMAAWRWPGAARTLDAKKPRTLPGLRGFARPRCAAGFLTLSELFGVVGVVGRLDHAVSGQ